MKTSAQGAGFDAASASKKIISGMHAFFSKSKKARAVLGLSGGVDSTVVAKLAVLALGSKNVTALLLPSSATPKNDSDDALALARQLGIKTIAISIAPLVSAFKKSLSSSGMRISRVAEGNISARIRMSLLYAVANETDALVLGTGDRSELMIGYFTKYGDGGCDLLPIGGLLKSEVRQLARHLNLPERIAAKPSSPHLWKGHRAEEELGASYEQIDDVLRQLDAGRKPKGKTAALVLSRIKNSEHKRSMAPIIKTN